MLSKRWLVVRVVLELGALTQRALLPLCSFSEWCIASVLRKSPRRTFRTPINISLGSIDLRAQTSRRRHPRLVPDMCGAQQPSTPGRRLSRCSRIRHCPSYPSYRMRRRLHICSWGLRVKRGSCRNERESSKRFSYIHNTSGRRECYCSTKRTAPRNGTQVTGSVVKEPS
jgi:hypothetical protein